MQVKVPLTLTQYDMTSVTQGIEALADTRVTVQPRGDAEPLSYVQTSQGRQYRRSFSGNGADCDIVVASVRAYVSALNKLITFLGDRSQEEEHDNDTEEMKESLNQHVT